jgi:hypothetical protein
MNIMQKNKFITTILLISLIFLVHTALAADQNAPPREDAILAAANNLFTFMKNKEYASIWKGLSLKSKKTIVDNVYKESSKLGVVHKKDDLMNDFNSGGTIAKEYWNSFLFVFDPNMVLEQCKWEMGKIEKNEAEVILLYKKSDRPAIIKMYKEKNDWKVGLEESFGARRANLF